MKTYIKEALGFGLTIYALGFLFVMVMVMQGYQGGDMLTEHYRSVLQFIVGLF